MTRSGSPDFKGYVDWGLTREVWATLYDRMSETDREQVYKQVVERCRRYLARHPAAMPPDPSRHQELAGWIMMKMLTAKESGLDSSREIGAVNRDAGDLVRRLALFATGDVTMRESATKAAGRRRSEPELLEWDDEMHGEADLGMSALVDACFDGTRATAVILALMRHRSRHRDVHALCDLLERSPDLREACRSEGRGRGRGQYKFPASEIVAALKQVDRSWDATRFGNARTGMRKIADELRREAAEDGRPDSFAGLMDYLGRRYKHLFKPGRPE